MDLNSVMKFDCVVRVNNDGTVTDDLVRMDAPEAVISTDSDGQISDDDEREFIAYVKRQGWSLLTGWTGQYGYAGPIMHPSEFVGGDLEDYILETPGFYVVIAVETLDDDEEAAGWAIAYREHA